MGILAWPWSRSVPRLTFWLFTVPRHLTNLRMGNVMLDDPVYFLCLLDFCWKCSWLLVGGLIGAITADPYRTG